MRDLVRKLLFERGLRPRALADHPEVEVGTRETKDTMVLTVVNHAPTPAKTAVTLFAPPFALRSLMDMKGRDHALEAVDGGVRLQLRLPTRSGLVLVGYPSRPAKFQLVVLTRTVRRGGRLRYRIIAQTKDGVLCEGHILTQLRVTDPSGEAHPRYGPAGFTADGVREMTARVAANAPRGTWRIELIDPFAGDTKTETFEVR